MELWIAAGFLALQCGLIGWDWMNRSRERKHIESLLQTKETEKEAGGLRLPGLLQCARLIMDLTLEEKSERHAAAENRLKEQLGTLELLLFDEHLDRIQARAVYAFRLFIQSALELGRLPEKKKESRMKRLMNQLLSDPEQAIRSGSPLCALALLLVRLTTISPEEFENCFQDIRTMDPDEEILKDALFSLGELY